MALYEWQDGKIGNVCVQGGARRKPYPAAVCDKKVARAPGSTQYSIATHQEHGKWRTRLRE